MVMAKNEWNHDAVLVLFSDEARGSISCNVILRSLGGAVFEDNNQQHHDATVYYSINN
jgi:hypothetical protein